MRFLENRIGFKIRFCIIKYLTSEACFTSDYVCVFLIHITAQFFSSRLIPSCPSLSCPSCLCLLQFSCLAKCSLLHPRLSVRKWTRGTSERQDLHARRTCLERFQSHDLPFNHTGLCEDDNENPGFLRTATQKQHASSVLSTHTLARGGEYHVPAVCTHHLALTEEGESSRERW